MALSAPSDSGPAPATSEQPDVPAPASWRWRRSALLLAIAAQLITISDLVGSDPPPRTWPSILLAIAPAPLALAAAFLSRALALVPAAAGVAVLATGIAGAWNHTGLFFVPSLVASTGGVTLLWRERS